MEATPEFTYQIEKYPEREQVGTIAVHSKFIRQDDMDDSNFSISLPTNEFTDEEDSPHKERLFDFLKDLGVDARDALQLIQALTLLACKLTSSFSYRSHYALLIWLTLYVAPSSTEGSAIEDPQVDESVLDDSRLEEAIQASLVEYDERMNSEFSRSPSKLSRRIHNRKRKTSIIANQSKRYKRKQKTCSSNGDITDMCTICFEEFGQEVATLLCGHKFDHGCIMDWFKSKVNCPLCRFELPREDDEITRTLTTIF
ncbi:hypothetical protein CARUB_v10027992mg [Capsella rubella]|uniref:RING-type E3 ubiquitin transferase n=1 Tax=Capsella rubella TaxID=81985 RepID=R0G845_9BRAS|nr:uncharacterized protein LOC17875677 [Capsella rubella]EOA12699.1 hypothetical protein CARUB_v10027992mg [Capsella rubella]